MGRMSNATTIGTPVKRGRGRPRKPYSKVLVPVRLHPFVYDEYDAIARRLDVPLAPLLQRELTRQAQKRRSELRSKLGADAAE